MAATLPLGTTEQDGEAVSLTGTRVEGNRILGADGIGIEILNAAGNRIVGNRITDVRRRDPFPGNTTGGIQAWAEANGSAIWVSSGSNGNEIMGNTFEEVASYAVVLEGDSNRVGLNNKNDEVQDLGNGNQVSSSDNADENKLDKKNRPKYESKFVEARVIRLQYMDLGGEGLPIIFLQDFHDYFYEGSEWPPFYAHFTSNHRVFAPIRGAGVSRMTPGGAMTWPRSRRIFSGSWMHSVSSGRC
jgi:parallel beta-helix repeat protein